jgi:hypothetical protein
MRSHLYVECIPQGGESTYNMLDDFYAPTNTEVFTQRLCNHTNLDFYRFFSFFCHKHKKEGVLSIFSECVVAQW